MPLATSTTVYDVDDLKVYTLTADSSGSAPTYSAGVDVPGVNQIGLDLGMQSAEIKGDGRVIARKNKLDRINGSIQNAKLALAVLDIVLGNSTLTQSGTTPNQTTRLRLAGPGSTPYFKVEFRITETDLGIATLNAVLYKCVVTGGSIFQTQSDQYGQPSLQFEAIPLEGTLSGDANVLADLTLYETAQALS